MRGLLAKYGPGPTEEEIDQNRREVFRQFTAADRDEFVEHDDIRNMIDRRYPA
jgi:hypothetical protein